MDSQLGCTEEESASLMQNSNEAAKAQGLDTLDALDSYGGRGKSAAAAASMVAAIVTSLLM